MRKIYCDLCSEETNETDIRYLSITKSEEEKIIPVIPEKEICIFCKEKIIKLLSNWG